MSQLSIAMSPLLAAHALRLQAIAGDPRVGPAAGFPHPLDEGWSASFVAWRRHASERSEAVSFAVIADRSVIGCASLYAIDGATQSGELALWLEAEYWGRGIGREVVSDLLRRAFSHLKLERVQARCWANNGRAVRLLLRAGFEFEANDLHVAPRGPAVQRFCARRPRNS
jgi:ribosomal-protein-alanine N-acetyltransferase